MNYQSVVADESHKAWKIRMFDSVKKEVSGQILELGCGVNPLFKSSTRVDIVSLKGCHEADLNYPLTFRDELFDTILALDVIEHLWDMDTMLKESYRILKPNGRLILTTPNLTSWRNRIAVLLGKNPFMDQYDKSGHVAFLCYRTLRNKLESLGFEVNIKPMGNAPMGVCGEVMAVAKKNTSLISCRPIW